MDPFQKPDHDENDLLYFLTHFRQFWDRYGTQVLWVLLVLSAALAIYRFWSIHSEQSHEAAWSDLAKATSPEGLRQAGNDLNNPPAVRALALLRGGDLLLQRATLPQAQTPADTQPAVAPADPKRDLEEAASFYNKVLEIIDLPPIYAINARMGLASVAEAQGNWQEAQAQWKQVEQQAAEDYRPIAAQARTRLQMMERLQEPVVFAPEAPGADVPMGIPGLPGGPPLPRVAPDAAPATQPAGAGSAATKPAGSSTAPATQPSAP